MVVRVEEPGDQDAVGAVHRVAFGGHGGQVADLVAALRRDDPAVLSLVFEEDGGEVVGHVAFSRSVLDAPRQLVPVQTLSPLGVVPQWQRRGIGSALIRAGLERLDGGGVPLVFLEGDPRYYRRAGFLPATESGFRKPSLRIPDWAFQVFRLSAYKPWMTGTLVYSHTFWDYDCVGRRDAESGEAAVAQQELAVDPLPPG